MDRYKQLLEIAENSSYTGKMLEKSRMTAEQAGVGEWYDHFIHEIKNARNVAECQTAITIIGAPLSEKSITHMATLDGLLQETDSFKEKVDLVQESIANENYGNMHVHHACFRLIQMVADQPQLSDLSTKEKQVIGALVREDAYTHTSLQKFAHNTGFWKKTDTKPLKIQSAFINNCRVIGGGFNGHFTKAIKTSPINNPS